MCVGVFVDKEHAGGVQELRVEEVRSEAFSEFMRRLIEGRNLFFFFSFFHVSVELLSAPLR